MKSYRLEITTSERSYLLMALHDYSNRLGRIMDSAHDAGEDDQAERAYKAREKNDALIEKVCRAR